MSFFTVINIIITIKQYKGRSKKCWFYFFDASAFRLVWRIVSERHVNKNRETRF